MKIILNIIIAIIVSTVLIFAFGMRVKGNGDSYIYHLPGCASYGNVSMNNHSDDKLFFTSKGAESSGYVKAKNCY